VESIAVNAKPTKPHASGEPVECLGYTINLEWNPLHAARIAKMIEISKEILHFEPDDRLTVGTIAMVSFTFVRSE